MRINYTLKKVSQLIVNIFICIFSISCVYPIAWIFYSSLKESSEFNRDIISLPQSINLSNYVKAFQNSNLAKYSFNSLFNATVSTAIIIILAFILAYFISRFNFKGRKILYIMFLFGMLVPVHALLIPIFIQFKNAGFFNKRFTLILPYVAFGLPFTLFLLESYLNGVPKELDEAAMIDGSGLSRTMFTIILPLCKPMLVAVGILSFFGNWNEFSFALVLINSDKYKTVSLALQSFSGQYATDYPTQMAAMVVAIAPVLILYLIFNKKIIEGMAEGAVKG